MKVTPTQLPEVLLLEPKVFGDDRGFFMESWNARTLREAIGLDVQFVQENHSRSARNVLRGIHYQLVKPQGKLVRVVAGTVFDVAVDLRRSSPNFGRWVGVDLSAENKRQLWIPPGVRTWISCTQRVRRLSLQDNRMLDRGTRSKHRLERCGPFDHVAPFSVEAECGCQGRERCAPG
jgi:hypothetical protein